MAGASIWSRIAVEDAAVVVAAADVDAPVRPALVRALAPAGVPAPAARRTRAPSLAAALSPVVDAPSPSRRSSRVLVPARAPSKFCFRYFL